MFRKLILSAIVAAGALTGVGLTAPAQAHEPTHGRDWDRRDRWDRFEVLVRHRGHWDSVGIYSDRDDAWRAARQIERRGGDARVRKVEFGRR